MFLLFPEIYRNNKELIKNHVRRMRLNTIGNAVDYLKSINGLGPVSHGIGQRYFERYKALNTLISYDCELREQNIEVTCDKISTIDTITIKYMSYFTR